MLSLELRDLIRNIVKDEFEEIYGVACKVSNVHEDEDLGFVCDCAPINGTATVTDVRLEPELKGGILITPSDGSVVFITMESETQAFVSMYGKIDSIQFFDGSNDGLININDLITKLNNLEGQSNETTDALKTHTHPGVTSGASSTAPSVDFVSIINLTETKKSDIEDNRITH